MGDGPDLLLLHGSGAATHSWRDLAPLLARDFRVIAPDLPGHGFTETPGGDGLSLPGIGARDRRPAWFAEVVARPCRRAFGRSGYRAAHAPGRSDWRERRR